MAALVKTIAMPNGSEYEFVGKQWLGYCDSSSSSQTKTVTIASFTRADIKTGVRIAVNFRYGNSVDSISLNINNLQTNQVMISYYSGSYLVAAGSGEWSAGAVIDFVFNGTYWEIINGSHATTSVYGKTRLSSNVYDSSSIDAVTPFAVASAIKSLVDTQYRGYDEGQIVLLDSTTPAASSWTQSGDYYSYTFTNRPTVVINDYRSTNRILKIKYADITDVFVFTFEGTYGPDIYNLIYYEQDTDNNVTVNYNCNNGTITVNTNMQNYVGINPIKLEYYYSTTAGFVPYPLLKEKLSGYLTLDTLPIWNGGVI